MAYSTIPAAKARILTTLTALGSLSGVLVAWGVPGEVPEQRERVYIDDATDIRRDWATLGRYTLEENYGLQLLVEVYQEGDDQRACEERMWVIVALVERAVLTDITLAGTLKWGAKPGAITEQKTLPASDGWLSYARMRIDCGARLNTQP